ncbi:hypothetical protein [Paracoccus sp. KR1-242]|uniref:hypothetical protein n=1 Tax=Paracoccus sp. KR1-242 TaxID=3410028 RepID=UPI003C0FCC60
MASTIEAHIEECRQVQDLLAEGSQLALGSREMLREVRITLETLREYQHPQVRMELPSHLRVDDAREDTAAGCVDRQIAAINALLGDRPVTATPEEGTEA